MSGAATTATGATRIRDAFERAKADQRAGLIPYVVAGRPTAAGTATLIGELVEAGADIIELGLPFSDPLADGAVIRDATRLALDAGMTIPGCLAIIRDVRRSGIDVPVICMGYVNPLLAYGIEQFCADAAAAGVDGLIVPDVPLEAADELRASAAVHGLGVTFLVTPLTEDARIAQLAAASTGFLYAVASTGTTGARLDVADATLELLDRARQLVGEVPVAVGFGVSTPAHVARLAPHADGVIVGSALVDLVERAPSDVLAWVNELHRSTHRSR